MALSQAGAAWLVGTKGRAVRIYKRDGGSIYYADLWFNGKRVTRSLQTSIKKEADLAAEKLRQELWRINKLGERKAVTFAEAADEWLAMQERNKRKNLSAMTNHVAFIKPLIGKVAVDQLDKTDIALVQRRKIADGARIREKGGNNKANTGRREVSNGTVNRYMATLSSIINYCVEQGYRDTGMKVPKLEEGTKRVRFLTVEQAKALLGFLPPHLSVMAKFALLTGLRQNNVTHMQWERVDLDRSIAWVEAESAKGKRLIPVQLPTDAVTILRSQFGQNPVWVFPYRGKPMTDPAQSSWKTALKKAGIENFRWHDLRHTWATWHVQAGTSLAVLKELGAWSSYDMVEKYAHVAPNHLAQFANNSQVNWGG
jgi:integrase